MSAAQESYSIRLHKELFTFCSAHFITFGENICEPLHGHNYQVQAELSGLLGPHEYVVDFIAARDTLARLTKALDHRVLLPLTHPSIKVRALPAERAVEAQFEERRWLFPQQDCVLLPVANTTAELLARNLGEQFLTALLAEYQFTPSSLELAVDECQGQWGVWRWKRDALRA